MLHAIEYGSRQAINSSKYVFQNFDIPEFLKSCMILLLYKYRVKMMPILKYKKELTKMYLLK